MERGENLFKRYYKLSECSCFILISIRFFCNIMCNKTNIINNASTLSATGPVHSDQDFPFTLELGPRTRTRTRSLATDHSAWWPDTHTPSKTLEEHRGQKLQLASEKQQQPPGNAANYPYPSVKCAVSPESDASTYMLYPHGSGIRTVSFTSP